MSRSHLLTLLVLLPLVLLAGRAQASAHPDPGLIVVEALADYLAFSEYSDGVIAPEQIPDADWPRIDLIDARNSDQFARGHIPNARLIEWRQSVARRQEIPQDGMVLMYCNTGALSAQAVLALRVLGWDNVRVLQGGYDNWLAKGGFEANSRALQNALP